MLNRNYKAFVSAVDEFTINWDKFASVSDKDEPDALSMDVYYKVLSLNLEDISDLYMQFEDKSKINTYLSGNINQYMFYQIYKYNKETTGHSYA